MLADGEKILVLAAVFSYVAVSSTAVMNSEQLFYAVVVSGHALASASVTGGGLAPVDLGLVLLSDEGTRWVRGWDNEARDALLAANKLRESDAAE